MSGVPPLLPVDRACLERVHALALSAEAGGNLPIATVIAIDADIVAEATNETRYPVFHPGRHAELIALSRVPPHSWVARAGHISVYTSLEPCVMCFGALVMHRVARVVFGSSDPIGGATLLIPHLPPYVRSKAQGINWVGPVLPSVFDPLAQRALALSGSTSGPAFDPGAA